MNQSTNFATDRLVEEFVQRLEILGNHHRQSCIASGTLRFMHDLEECHQAPEHPSSRLIRTARWLLNTMATVGDAPDMAQPRRSYLVIPEPFATMSVSDATDQEDEVIVIDAEYHVIYAETE